MCLGVPGKIVSVTDIMGMRSADVDISGVKRQVSLDLCPEAKEDDFVLVHAGFAIQIIDEQEAEETLKLLQDLTGVELPETENAS